MLLGTLGAILLGNLLTGTGATATIQGRGIYRAGKGKEEGIVRAGYGNHGFLISPQLILKYKNIIKMSLDLMGFILEII